MHNGCSQLGLQGSDVREQLLYCYSLFNRKDCYNDAVRDLLAIAKFFCSCVVVSIDKHSRYCIHVIPRFMPQCGISIHQKIFNAFTYWVHDAAKKCHLTIVILYFLLLLIHVISMSSQHQVFYISAAQSARINVFLMRTHKCVFSKELLIFNELLTESAWALFKK